MEPKPLEGIRILDLTRLLPGGFCTMLLLDLGAEVLKVEEPGRGDYVRWMPPFRGETSSGHLALNRGKQSMTLNLKDPRGVEVLGKLCETHDVLLESFRPGVMDRLGAGFDVMSARNPSLVWCAITGYGQDGPYKDRAGHDANYLGYAGVTDYNGWAGGPPVMIGTQIADLGGGALMAAIGICAALYGRTATGRGRFIDISMTDGAFSWMGYQAARYFFAGEFPVRGRGHISGGQACYRLYECGDGGWIALGALEPQFWDVFCTELGVPEFVSLQGADQGEQDRMAARITEMLSTAGRDEWVKRFEHLEACVAPINTLEEAIDDPHLVARGMVTTAMTPDGPIPTIASPIRQLREKPGPIGPAPGFGEHTDVVLREAGYDDAAIASLRADGVI
ncbi:MAG: CaiB/BaiF CoA transferase family protein [Actinomycetota bacterium]|nr:CoA transferase [Actinomycetota bacterium]